MKMIIKNNKNKNTNKKKRVQFCFVKYLSQVLMVFDCFRVFFLVLRAIVSNKSSYHMFHLLMLVVFFS